MVHASLEAAAQLAGEGIEVEVVDLRTLLPLDRETILESVRRTNKLLVVHEDTRTGGIAGEIAALVSEAAFEDLDGPIRRVTSLDTPVPFSPPLEEHFLPNADAHRRGGARSGTLLNARCRREADREKQEQLMAVDVIMPQMGESIFEGTITKWLKKPGDQVERDEPLFEISTDKVDAEIPSPAAGVLREIKIAEGQTVPVKTVVAVIDAAGTGLGRFRGRPRARAKRSQPAAPPRSAPQETAARSHGRPRAPQPAESRGDGQAIRSSPLVRRLAREKNIDLATVRGTGAGGRISKSDILAAISLRRRACRAGRTRPPPAAVAAPHAVLETAVPRERIYFGRYEVQPMSVMRQRIAEHMVLSKRVSPHVYSIDEADMTHVAQLRAAAKERIREAQRDQAHLHALLRARLRRGPARVSAGERLGRRRERRAARRNQYRHRRGAGGRPDRAGGEERRREKFSVALQRAINDLAERARAKKLKPEEVQESTFSITNPGIFGGLMGLPVINQPNVAILAIGAIQKRPGGGRRRHRHPLDGLSGSELRPPHRGRRHRAPVHGAGEAPPGNLGRRDSVAANRSVSGCEPRARVSCPESTG